MGDDRVFECEDAEGRNRLQPRIFPHLGGHGLQLPGAENRGLGLVEDLGYREFEPREVVKERGLRPLGLVEEEDIKGLAEMVLTRAKAPKPKRAKPARKSR